MVVDDAEYMREMIGDIIGNYDALSGYELAGVAADGEEAIAKYRELVDAGMRPDVVTMDIVMSKIDGITVIKEIRKQDPDARILAISALDSPDTINRAMKAGATDYITKPFTVTDLMAKIQHVTTTVAEAGEAEEECLPARENVIAGTIVSSDGGYAVITVQNAAIEAMSDYAVDDRVKVHIDPWNIELRAEPDNIRNRLEGTVLEILRSTPVSQVKLDCGFNLSVDVPSKTLSELHLAVGDRVYATFGVLSAHVTR
ncbi:MAG: Chemotaxis protein CheY [Candidatus Methanogaster sp.]|nr:MAG: Chemotaxis protein CheY [ANME-2 cluster archaeon]